MYLTAILNQVGTLKNRLLSAEDLPATAEFIDHFPFRGPIRAPIIAPCPWVPSLLRSYL